MIGHDFAGQAAAYGDYVSNTSISVAGGAPKQLCPLCPDEHLICKFAAGTLYCCRRNCPNPHHRELT